jgi:hypothetical protein
MDIRRWPRAVIAIAGDLHRFHDAFVVWWQPASLISLAIAASKTRQSSRRCNIFCNFFGNLPNEIERTHFFWPSN